MRSKPEGKQIRMTLEDTLRYQAELKSLIKTLISENRTLNYKEKKQYFEMITKALLSQGCTDPVYFVKENGWFIFSSVQNFAHRLADLTTNRVKISTNRPERIEVTLDISELWVFLYDKFLYLFPQSCAEALHLSAESVERLKQGSYKFSSKEDLA